MADKTYKEDDALILALTTLEKLKTSKSSWYTYLHKFILEKNTNIDVNINLIMKLVSTAVSQNVLNMIKQKVAQNIGNKQTRVLNKKINRAASTAMEVMMAEEQLMKKVNTGVTKIRKKIIEMNALLKETVVQAKRALALSKGADKEIVKKLTQLQRQEKKIDVTDISKKNPEKLTKQDTNILLKSQQIQLAEKNDIQRQSVMQQKSNEVLTIHNYIMVLVDIIKKDIKFAEGYIKNFINVAAGRTRRKLQKRSKKSKIRKKSKRSKKSKIRKRSKIHKRSN